MKAESKQTKVYISGQISGIDMKFAMLNFHNAKMMLYQYSECSINDIINPFDIKPLFGIKKWLFYMIADLWQLRKCTHIALQRNWIDSKGACIEHYIGKFIFKLEVIYL